MSQLETSTLLVLPTLEREVTCTLLSTVSRSHLSFTRQVVTSAAGIGTSTTTPGRSPPPTEYTYLEIV